MTLHPHRPSRARAANLTAMLSLVDLHNAPSLQSARVVYRSSPSSRPERNSKRLHPRRCVAYCAFAAAARFIVSRFHMPVARLRSVTKPTAAAASMIILVGLNWRSMPYSEAA